MSQELCHGPRLSLLGLGVLKKPIPLWAGLGYNKPCISKAAEKGTLCMAGKKGYVNQSSRQQRQKLGKEQGSMEKKHRGSDAFWKQKLTIYCSLIQQIPTHSQTKGQQVPWCKTKQSKIQSTSHTKASFGGQFPTIDFSKRLLTTELQKHTDWDLGFKSLHLLRK